MEKIDILYFGDISDNFWIFWWFFGL